MHLELDSKQPIIDLDFFESRRQVGEDFLDKLIEVFEEEALKLIRKIKETAECNDPKHLAELGHKLKGMSLNVGAVLLSNLGRQIELRSNDLESASLKSLDIAYEQTMSEMKKLVG